MKLFILFKKPKILFYSKNSASKKLLYWKAPGAQTSYNEDHRDPPGNVLYTTTGSLSLLLIQEEI